MSDLRQAAQQALEALEWNYNTDLDNIPACEQWAKMLNETIPALKQALAEPDSDYERGFVDGMNLQTKRSVDKAVNRMAQTTHWEGCEAVHPECRKQEPVAWMVYTDGGASAYVTDNPNDLVGAYRALPLYTAPTPRKPLTDEALHQVIRAGNYDSMEQFARAIERHHGIGEQHE